MIDIIFLIKAIISFLFLFVLTRLMGVKQLAQLTYFDYIVGITIGNFTASMVIEPEIRMMDAVIGITVWGVLPIFLSYLSRKRSSFRRLLEGSPTLVIENGKFRTEGLIKENLTAHNIMLLLRKGGNFKLEDIELAILEKNGDVSVIQKKSARNVTVSDLNQTEQSQKEPRVLIIDGYLLEGVLKELNLSKDWLLDEIKKKGATSLQEVLIAQLQPDGTLYVDIWISDVNQQLKS
ncbi:YetF domain-containing protein [Niallia sp. Krafla_26]|uniref:YetF domain-containing protein n=1 Tax=Niallia sp. Krafla_26 TaxID=3064703 RepID=UPI003D16A2C0